MSGQMPSPIPQDPTAPPEGKADFTLRIAPVTVELAPERILSTIGYNGISPGPILRMREGKPITVDVINDTDIPELVHWHGLLIPAEVDGVEEEATPFVPPQGRRRYQFTPRPPAPAGTTPTPWPFRPAQRLLHRPVRLPLYRLRQRSRPVRSGALPRPPRLGALLHQQYGGHRRGRPERPQPEKPAVLNTAPNGLEVNSTTYSINDKSLGAGEPIRVKEGQRSPLPPPQRQRHREPPHRAPAATSSRSSPSTATQSLRPSRSKPSSLARASASTPSSR